jgi:hypothetical protein
VFCEPVAPKPRRSTVVVAALLPKRSRIVMPTSPESSSGSVRAGLRAISPAVITVVLAGSRRTSSGKRVASTSTASWAEETETNRASASPDKRKDMENLPDVIPDVALVEKASRPVSGLARYAVSSSHRGLPCSDTNETVLSLTVAGAVEASHLVPGHLAASPIS